MTSEQRYQAMLEEIRKLRSALMRLHKAVQDAGVDQNADILASIEESTVVLATGGTWEHAPITPPPPFGSEEFYRGSMQVLGHLIEVARQTHGSGVWEGLLSRMRDVLVFEMKEKGFQAK